MSLPEIVNLSSKPDLIDHGNQDRFFNRELSWLQFNKRVLDESANNNHPLFERIRFLSISASNLDEFYMVRVAGLRGQMLAGIETPSQEGLTPNEQLDKISEFVAVLSVQQQELWVRLNNELATADIHVIEPKMLGPDETQWLEDYFLKHIFPVLTPIAVDPAHPFPFIPNLGFSLGLDLHRARDDRSMYALMPIPGQLDRFIRLPFFGKSGVPDGCGAIRFIRQESVASHFVSRLFPGYTVVSHGAFRVLRDSDSEIQDEAEDLVRLYESALKRRRRGSVIRLEIEATMSARLQRFVIRELQASDRKVFIQKGLIGLNDTAQLIVKDRPDLKFKPFNIRFPSVFATMAAIVLRPFSRRISSSTTPMSPSMWCCNS